MIGVIDITRASRASADLHMLGENLRLRIVQPKIGLADAAGRPSSPSACGADVVVGNDQQWPSVVLEGDVGG